MSWDDVVVVIPTMPARAKVLAELVQRLPHGAIVSEHTESRDDFPRAIERGLTTGAPWILQLEDDVWPAPGFGMLAVKAIGHTDAVGAGAVTMFSRASVDITMLRTGQRYRWQAPSSFCMMQAVAVRAALMTGFAAWAPSWYAEHPEHVHAADLLLGAWLSKRRARMLVHVPSLVQHRKGPSTLPGGRASARQSATYTAVFGEAP